MKLPASHPLQLVLGLTVWLVWFGVAYGSLSVACAVAPPAPERGAYTWVNAGLLLLTLATALGLAWAAWAAHRAARRAAGPQAPRERFLAWSASALHATAMASTLVVGVPLALLPPCI
jgi:hypothetical protein